MAEERRCEACGEVLIRKRFGKRLETPQAFTARHTCDRECAGKANTARAGRTESFRAERAKRRSA